MNQFFTETFHHPEIGKLTVFADDSSIVSIKLDVQKKDRPSTLTSECIRQLSDYFGGRLKEFDLPLDISSGTAFNQEVWNLLLSIEYGKTESYGSLAKILGKPTASRAVGHANGQNPIPILIPCHRVIGSNGKLTGYALGLEMKRKLLELEGVINQRSLF